MTDPTPPLSFAERLQGSVARVLGRLPASLLCRLSGEPPVSIDGQTLDPQLQFIRAVRRKQSPYGYCEPTVPVARARLRREAAIFTGPRTRVGAVRDFTIPGAAGPLRVRHYAPEGPGGTPQPLLVYLHGGGFVVCDLETHDEPCRILCLYAGVHVLSVDYRLAPEHPFPAGLHDAQAALRWAQDNAATLGADPTRVAIGGDSAGGNMGTVVARLVARAAGSEAGPAVGPDAAAPLAGQLLIYPATDPVTPRPSHALFGTGFFLDQRDLDAFVHYYADGTGVVGTDPLVAPLHAPDLGGLAPALVVTAGFDVLRDEGEAYAAALRLAGTVTRLCRFPTLGHAFINMTGVCSTARQAMIRIALEWRTLLDDTRVMTDVRDPGARPVHDQHTTPPRREAAHGVRRF